MHAREGQIGDAYHGQVTLPTAQQRQNWQEKSRSRVQPGWNALLNSKSFSNLSSRMRLILSVLEPAEVVVLVKALDTLQWYHTPHGPDQIKEVRY